MFYLTHIVQGVKVVSNQFMIAGHYDKEFIYKTRETSAAFPR